jgi:hypothetical protein
MSDQNLSLSSGITSSETTYQSLVKQLLTQLSDPQKSQNLSDVRHNTSLIKSFTSTMVGSFFGSTKLAHRKPLVADAQVVIIFVVGGVTGAEMVDVHDVVSRASNGALANKTILIGGTRLATPDFVYDNILCVNNMI